MTDGQTPPAAQVGTPAQAPQPVAQPAPAAINAGVNVFVSALHQKCSASVAASVAGDAGVTMGDCKIFAADLEAWKAIAAAEPIKPLLVTAGEEYTIALLNCCQGQYRNAFKSLRLVLELVLQATKLSTDLLSLGEWLQGAQDTTWASLVDADAGPLSKRFCAVFFPEVKDDVPNYLMMAKTVYRELSECVHGNTPNYIPLPTTLDFSGAAFEKWREKAGIVRSVSLFALAMRYLPRLSPEERTSVALGLTEELGHIPAIRTALGGPGTA